MAGVFTPTIPPYVFLLLLKSVITSYLKEEIANKLRGAETLPFALIFYIYHSVKATRSD